MTEDDTYRALKKPIFNDLRIEWHEYSSSLFDGGRYIDVTWLLPEFLEQRGWTVGEYYAELRRGRFNL